MLYAAVDIGGTSIKYGIINKEGVVLFRYETPTEAHKGGEKLMEKVIHLVETLWHKSGPLVGIGISTAGQVNVQAGSIEFATDTLPGWTGMPVASILEERFQIPVAVENDVNAAALGEAWKGAGEGVKDFLCLTIGTGIGGAIVTNGQIYHGSTGSAGEFGHIRLERNGKACTCGQLGCFEQYASTSALVKEAQLRLKQDGRPTKELDGRQIFEQAKLGQEVFVSLIEDWTGDIALGLASLCHIFNPSLIVLGGGVSKQGAFLSDKLEQKLGNLLMPSFRKNLKIAMATCGNEAGMLGAVSLLVK
ncbi:ROK family protein [Limibacter armeniacum]|uniref:ROK family protein n=1 Tax=Limibacter armeniacum TaxID=466084 RepID=UPI002FE5C5B5